MSKYKENSGGGCRIRIEKKKEVTYVIIENELVFV